MMNHIEAHTKTCRYQGTVGQSVCFCRHDSVSGSRPSVSVQLDKCRECPLFEPLAQGPQERASTVCVHRGDLLRLVDCVTCGGTKQAGVLSCAVHGECAKNSHDWNLIRKAENGTRVKGCARCKDFESARPVTSHRKLDESLRIVSLNGDVGTVRQTGGLRVGVLTPVLAVGGVERWLITLAKATSELQWQGCAVHEGGVIDARSLEELSRLMPVTYNRVKLLAECDVIITWAENHCPQLNDFPGKVVHVIHGCTDWSAYCARVNAERVDCFVGVAPVASAVAPRECVTILNAIDVERFADFTPRRDSGEFTVGYVGRFSREKDPLAAARAAAELGCRVVYCSTSELPGWQDQVRELCPDAIFIEPDEPATAYSMMDCFVMASEAEGFGLTFAEAWYLGIPIVSHAVGIVEIAERQAGKQLTERIADHQTLGSAVMAAIVSKQRVESAKQVARNYYLPQRMGEEYQRLLNDVMENRSSSLTTTAS